MWAIAKISKGHRQPIPCTPKTIRKAGGMNNSESDSRKPDDGHGLSPVSLCAGQCLPEWKKGHRCRMWIAGRYHAVIVVRRMPGPVYWVVVEAGARRSERHIMSASNWGGDL